MGIHRFTGCSIGGTDIRHVSFVGAFAVVERQSECGSKTAEMHVSQPMDIGVCYGLGFYFSFEILFNSFLNFSETLIGISVFSLNSKP